jgi:hypothetical protein
MPMSGSVREDVPKAFLEWVDSTSGFALGGVLTFDVVRSEMHEISSEITEHSVETGVAVADHVRPNVDKVVLEVFVSNTPINSPDADYVPRVLELDQTGPSGFLPGGLAGLLNQGLIAVGLRNPGPTQFTVNVDVFNGDIDYVETTYTTLRMLRDTATLITLHTSRAPIYENMILESFRDSRDASTGTGANFTLNLRQIRIVASQIVAAPLPAKVASTPVASKGKKDTKKAPAPDRSHLRNAVIHSVGAGPAALMQAVIDDPTQGP